MARRESHAMSLNCSQTLIKLQAKLHRRVAATGYPVDRLFAHLVAPLNLHAAWDRVRATQGANTRGPDRLRPSDLQPKISTWLAQLADQLRNGSYVPGAPRWLALPKSPPATGARRVGILALSDRVVHAAFKQILEPLLEPIFAQTSFGFRPGRSVAAALAEASRLLAGPASALPLPWAVHLDVADCFDSVDHGLLMAAMRRYIAAAQLLFTAKGMAPLRLDPDALKSLFFYGPVGVSDEAMQILFRHKIETAWLTKAGFRCHGRLVNHQEHAAQLRIIQHTVLAHHRHKLTLARSLVAAKIASQLEAARHYQRQGHKQAGHTIARLTKTARQCHEVQSLDALRGVEGYASAVWFDLLGQLLDPPWHFSRRSRRPPADPANALLSLAYTWLTNRAVALVQAYGLEVALGALHDYHPGRPSLACDLIEPLRVPAVDRWVVVVCNRKQLLTEHFIRQGKGFRLQPQMFGRTMASWERHWADSQADAKLRQQIDQFVSAIRQLYTATAG